MLALMVGVLLTIGGYFRLGWIADLLSIPVITGFLAGIAGHIVVSQAPTLLGVAESSGSTIEKAAALIARIGSTNVLTLLIGIGVLVTISLSERINPRVPGALIGIGAATALVAIFNFEAHGVSTLGSLVAVSPHLVWPSVSWDDVTRITPLAFIITIIVMVQTAATTRSFASGQNPDVDRDFIGVGAANILAGLMGTFPVNASPPRTAVVAETGGASQLGALICAALALALSVFGAGLLDHVPHAALAGVLLYVAQRIVRVATMRELWQRSSAEFGLMLLTLLAILVLPIQDGVAIGVILSLSHGVWSITRAKVVEFQRIPGSTVWWPKSDAHPGETVPGVRVIALQAPLSFLNAYAFQHAFESMIEQSPRPHLLVIEANAIAEIDYSAAKILAEVITQLRNAGIDVAFARLESVRAQESFSRLGLEALIGGDHLFHSVEEAVRALTTGLSR
jgi:MFS superfamily sulfate permease-like transporter